MRHKLAVVLGGGLIAATVAFLPPAAHADAGIPMLPVQYPEILLYILPVILIEAVYLQRQLNTRLRRTMIAVTLVNLVTVALGYPLAWAMYKILDWMFGFPPVTTPMFYNLWKVPVWISMKMFPAWVGLREGMWTVLAVWVALLIPSFLLTGLVKAWLVGWYDLLNFKGNTRPAVWMANRYSYFFLSVTGCVLLYLTYSSL
ncbi:MAG: hypothetical protein WCA44_05545 [Acidobacteriaceae bacterium]|jgi:hypothetical protein